MNNLQTKFPHIAIKLNEPLSKYTYTKTGGAADVFVMPKTIEEAQEVVAYCHQNKIPLTILGNGSNLIIKDGEFAVLSYISIYYKPLKEITPKLSQ